MNKRLLILAGLLLTLSGLTMAAYVFFVEGDKKKEKLILETIREEKFYWNKIIFRVQKKLFLSLQTCFPRSTKKVMIFVLATDWLGLR